MAFWRRTTEEEPHAAVVVQRPDPVSEVGQDALHLDPVEEDLMRRFGRVRTALSPGTVIQGRLSFDSPVRIDGKLSGHIFSSQTLLIGKGAEVSADVEADVVVVLGNLKGSVKAGSKIEVFAGAKVDANLSAPCLIVKEGAMIQGKCRIKLN